MKPEDLSIEALQKLLAEKIGDEANEDERRRRHRQQPIAHSGASGGHRRTVHGVLEPK